MSLYSDSSGASFHSLSNLNQKTCNPYQWGIFPCMFDSQTRRHLGKGLSFLLPCNSKGTWDRATLGGSAIFDFFACDLLVSRQMKKISSFFDTLKPSRKCPVADIPQTELHSLTDDNLTHEGKKMQEKFSTKLETNVSIAKIY